MRRGGRTVTSRNKLASKDPRIWAGRMKDVPCFMIGNSPSLEHMDLSVLDNYFTVGINRIFYIYDPTVLVWQDLALWIQEKNKVMETKAVKYCREGAETKGGFYTFKLDGRESKISHDLRLLYGRGSSGSITYQFVYNLGCNPIICVGMDCAYSDGKTDFYGNNPMHKPHTIPNCKKGLKFMMSNTFGRHLINCSDTDLLGKRYTLDEAISMLGEKKYNREALTKMLLGEET